MSVLDVLTWLEFSAVGRLVNESRWGFPIVVTVHILGLAASAGLIVWFDLRLLGVAMRTCPVRDVYRCLIPWAATGFAVMFVTGGLLFIGYATLAYGNPYFLVKMAAIALAGLNALVYHRVTERRVAVWNDAVQLPMAARTAGLLSIACWAAAVLAGRMMSYTMF